MTHFYRYIRPQLFNETRVELQTVPHGGVCLRFDTSADGTLWFSHARCHGDELFSKSVARKVVDSRAAMYAQHASCFGGIQPTKDTDVLVEAVIAWCNSWVPSDDSVLLNKYVAVELSELSKTLAALVADNHREAARAEIWKMGISAKNVGLAYENLSR